MLSQAARPPPHRTKQRHPHELDPESAVSIDSSAIRATQVTGEATRTLRPFQEAGLRLTNDRAVRSNAWRAAQV